MDKNDAQLPLENILDPEKPVEEQKPDIGARKKFQNKEAQAQDEGKAEIQRARDEAGKFKEKTDEKQETKQEAKPDTKVLEDWDRKYKASIAQANAERAKRQELERQINELKAQKKEPDKPFWDAPEESLNRIRDEVKQSTQSIRDEFRAEMTRARLNSSEQVARSKHTDFDQAIEVFSQMAVENPSLGQQWLSSPDPAEFAYKAGKTQKQLQDVGDIDKLRDQIKKETRLELEAELKSKEEALKKERDALPGSLSDARGTTQNKSVWTGPTPLGEIVRH